MADSVPSIAGSTCSQCFNKAIKFCKGCESFAYCSEKCQIADSLHHKMVCKGYKDFKARPTDPLPTDLSMVNFDDGPMVECIKATCIAHRELTGAAPFEKVKVSVSHPIFGPGGRKSDISERIGMPLVTMKLPFNAQWDDISNGQFNKVTFMHVCINPDTVFAPLKDQMSFGCAPPSYQNSVGNVLIASASGESLDGELIDAFGDYCQHHITAFLQWQIEAEEYEEMGYGSEDCESEASWSESGESEDGVSEDGISEDSGAEDREGLAMTRQKQRVLDEITPAKWQEYLKQWKAAKTDPKESGDPDLAEATAWLHRMALNEDDNSCLTMALLRRPRTVDDEV